MWEVAGWDGGGVGGGGERRSSDRETRGRAGWRCGVVVVGGGELECENFNTLLDPGWEEEEEEEKEGGGGIGIGGIW